jgi:hypothetical protein
MYPQAGLFSFGELMLNDFDKQARNRLRAGRTIRLEDLESELVWGLVRRI